MGRNSFITGLEDGETSSLFFVDEHVDVGGIMHVYVWNGVCGYRNKA